MGRTRVCQSEPQSTQSIWPEFVTSGIGAGMAFSSVYTSNGGECVKSGTRKTEEILSERGRRATYLGKRKAEIKEGGKVDLTR